MVMCVVKAILKFVGKRVESDCKWIRVVYKYKGKLVHVQSVRKLQNLSSCKIACFN